ncbi:MAG: aldehyde dehydrogenase family protein [Pseudomonadota bacterium]
MNAQSDPKNYIENLWFPIDQVFIGGAFVPPLGGQTHPLYDPSTGQQVGVIARGDAQDIDRAVKAAHAGFSGPAPASDSPPWGQMSAQARGRVLFAIAAQIKQHSEDLARLEAIDVGKPLSQARADVAAMARYFEFYGGAADKVMGETIPYQRGYTVYTLREALGVTGHIVPWNYPMQIIGRSVGASLAMGNCCVVKPAEQACLTVLALAGLTVAAGLPPGALNIVPGLGVEAGAALAAHREIAHVSFTGSVDTGKQVQAAASTHVASVTLELGGKSPQIIFADADLERAADFLLRAGIQNAGQTCSASSRLLVAEQVHEKVSAMMAERYRALRAGPALENFDLGPLISTQQRARVGDFLSLAKDLHVLAEGQLAKDIPAQGYYQPPVLLHCDDPHHTLAQEEIFGPVQLVIPFTDEAQAIDIANGTRYGLVAAVWTRDGDRQLRMARALRAGQVFLNNYGAGGGVELPFGGVGESGHGREKGFEALYGFSALKTVAAHHGTHDDT